MANIAFLAPLLVAALSGRRKRHRRAARFLTGNHRGSFWNGSTLLAALGLGVGAYEVFRSRQGGSSNTSTVVDGLRTPDSGPPPLPPPSTARNALPEGVQRLVRLMVAAARADGELGEEEYGRLVTEARALGAEALVEGARENPLPLSEIVAGVRDPAHKREIYVLAYGIVRADEEVTGAERIWLTRLASLLGFDPSQLARIEKETDERIDRDPENEG